MVPSFSYFNSYYICFIKAYFSSGYLNIISLPALAYNNLDSLQNEVSKPCTILFKMLATGFAITADAAYLFLLFDGM